MKRSLMFALLLLTVPAFAEDVTVHFDVSDSVRDAMKRGDIKTLRVAIATQGYADTKTTTAVIKNVAPGTWTARACKAGAWGFAAPIDGKGRFAFPVPHAGDYNLEVWLEGRKKLTTIEHFPIKDSDHEIHVALPASSSR